MARNNPVVYRYRVAVRVSSQLLRHANRVLSKDAWIETPHPFRRVVHIQSVELALTRPIDDPADPVIVEGTNALIYLTEICEAKRP